MTVTHDHLVVLLDVGGGSHRIAVRGDIGELTDPDGFGWETSASERIG